MQQPEASSVQSPNTRSAPKQLWQICLHQQTRPPRLLLWGCFNDDQKQIWKNCCSITCLEGLQSSPHPNSQGVSLQEEHHCCQQLPGPKVQKSKADLTNCATTELITSGFLSIDEINPGGPTKALHSAAKMCCQARNKRSVTLSTQRSTPPLTTSAILAGECQPAGDSARRGLPCPNTTPDPS